METIFSIVRRKFIHRRKAAAMAPDRLHLHSLVYRRRMLGWVGDGRRRWLANAGAALWVLGFAAAPALLALFNPGAAPFNAAVVLAGAIAYVLWFRRLTLCRRWQRGASIAAKGQLPIRAALPDLTDGVPGP